MISQVLKCFWKLLRRMGSINILSFIKDFISNLVMIVAGEVLHKLGEVETLARLGIGLGFSLYTAPSSSRSRCISNFRGVRSGRSFGETLVDFLTTELLIYIHIIY